MGELCRLAGVSPRVERRAGRLRPNEQPRMVGDPARLRRDTGWTPAIAWEQTLQALLDDWENGQP